MCVCQTVDLWVWDVCESAARTTMSNAGPTFSKLSYGTDILTAKKKVLWGISGNGRMSGGLKSGVFKQYE